VGTFLLLDGHSLAYRAWFALQDAALATSSGQDTTAVFGFVSMTTRLLTDWQPTGMAAALDAPGPTFRDEISSVYKAGRTAAPEAFHSQIELVRKFLQLLGVPVLTVPGYEADDVLATLATQLRDAGEDVIVVTGDRDTYQLVEDPHVRVLYNRRGVTDYVLYDEAGIAERTGVAPPRYPLLAALRGDTSDNLPGVPGVGEKTAAKLVNTYLDIDEIYAHLGELTPKLRESMAANEAQVRQNLQMIPLVRDVPLECVVPDDLRFGGWDADGLTELLGFLEMRAPRDRLFDALDKLGAGTPLDLGADKSPGGGADAVEIGPLRRPADAPEAVELLSELAARHTSVIVEPDWTGLAGRSELAGLAILAASGEGAPDPAPGEGEPDPAPGSAETDSPPGDGGADLGGDARSRYESYWLDGELLAGEGVAPALAALLAVGGGGFSAHRAKELMRWMGTRFGLDPTGLDLDLAVASYIVDPAAGQSPLEELARHAGLGDAASPQGSAPQGQLGFDLGGGEAVDRAEAAAARAAVVAAIVPHLRAELTATGLDRLYDEIERPLVRVLARMEAAGIGVGLERLHEIHDELTSEASRLELEVQELAGEKFNVNSTQQLRTILYERLGLTPSRKTKTGYSTDATALERLRGTHPVVDALLRYREVEKLRSTGDTLLAEVAADGRIHASFGQTVARTGRLSSDQPNLHNIPVRTDEGRRFREAFVPAPGTELLVADYNQIELRVIAHLADDPGLVEAFTAGIDIHNATASRVFSVPPEQVTLAQRSKAKMISYGLAYGMEAYGLSTRLAIPVEEAAVILDQYFAAFPAVRAYMDRTVAETRLRGYTETLFGRRRFIPELDSSNYRIRQAAERQAMNAGIQGLAADIFKVALVRLDSALDAGGFQSRIVLQVHDEVLLEVPEHERTAVGEITVGTMRGACDLRVPLEVNVAWGHSWAEAKGG
jgi:DNA polymerase I